MEHSPRGGLDNFMCHVESQVPARLFRNTKFAAYDLHVIAFEQQPQTARDDLTTHSNGAGFKAARV